MARFTDRDRLELNVNLNSIPTKIPEVFENQIWSLRPFVDMLLKAANSDSFGLNCVPKVFLRLL